MSGAAMPEREARRVRSELLASLRRTPALAGLRIDDPSDPIVAICDAFVMLARQFDFYQRRVLEEAFLASAEQESSIELLYHSLGARFPPNAAAVTGLAYHLSDKTAGVEAVTRARTNGSGAAAANAAALAQAAAAIDALAGAASTGTLDPANPASDALRALATGGAPTSSAAASDPSLLGVASVIAPASQVRAVPASSARPPTFITLEEMVAVVGASRLTVAAPPPPLPAPLRASTTQLELDGTRTGLAVGQPVLIVASRDDGEQALQWIRPLSLVSVDAKRGSTRIGWVQRLDSAAESFEHVGSPIVYGFGSSAALLGASAPPWTSLSAAQQLAVPTLDDRATPSQDDRATPSLGGLLGSEDAGHGWTARSAGVPAGAQFSALAVYGGVVLAAGSAGGLLRGVGTEALTSVALGGSGRRTIVFLGGRRERMLAAGAGGTVLQSIDDGRTWSPVTGGAPHVEGTGSSTKVRSTQLPVTMVRSVVERTPGKGETPDLLAATDAGVYTYAGGEWAAPSEKSIAVSVLDLLAIPHGTSKTTYDVFAATGEGVKCLPAGDGGWGPWGSGIAERVFALAYLSGYLYAATDRGVMRSPSQTAAWTQANGSGSSALPESPVTSLVAGRGALFAGTAAGLYRSTDGGTTWQAASRRLLFSFAGDALAETPPVGERGPDAPSALCVVFAAQGLALGHDAKLAPQPGGYLLSDGELTYELTLASASWSVWRIGSLGPISALAADLEGGASVLAAGPALTSAATDWPGFAVGGETVEIAPPNQAITPTTLAVLEQRTEAEMCAQAFTVTAVEQLSLARFGREAPATRIAFEEPVPFTAYPRRSTRLWTGATPLALFAQASNKIQRLTGTEIPLAKPLLAPVPAGRLGSLTGSPVGLAVLPMGGLLRISPSATGVGTARASLLAPAQVDVLDVAVDPEGVVYLAVAEGVMRLEPGGKPQLLSKCWPGGTVTAVALGGGEGVRVLAGSSKGLFRLQAGTGETCGWVGCGLPGGVASMACAGNAVVAAHADGSVAFCADSALAWSWQTLPPLDGPVTALLLDGSEVVAATASGVYTSTAGGRWSSRGQIPDAETVSSMVLDGDGGLWACVASGLLLQPRDSQRWQREPGLTLPVEALALDPLLQPIALGATGVARRSGGVWSTLGAAPGAPVSTAAMGLDQTLWIGLRAEIEIELPDGSRAEPLRLATLIEDVELEASDVVSLDQGALPEALSDAILAAGEELSAPATTVSGSSGAGAWLVRSQATLVLLALRGDGARSWVVVCKPQLALYPTAKPKQEGELERWEVLAEEMPGVIRVRGERLVDLAADAAAPSFAETVRVASVSAGQGEGSVLTLDRSLGHVYDPATVRVNLNVVSAAHGQPVSVAIGSGDPNAIHQSFAVPTPVAAVGATPAQPDAEIRTTLIVTVAGQQWRETESLEECGPQDTVYVAVQNADGTVTVHFGDGVHGARLPAGHDNVRAVYVQGGGPSGEATQGALIQPLDRPQLVTAVENPAPALVPPTAPARKSRLAAMRTLGGIVTASDYEHAAMGQAGVRSATAQLVAGRSLVVTVAADGGSDAPLLDRLRALLGASTASGLPVKVLIARPVAVHASIDVIAAEQSVEGPVRAALDGLSALRPGAPLRASRVLSAIVAVPGVAAAEVLGWSRAGGPAAPLTAVLAAPASWPSGLAAPRAAELLSIDAARVALRLGLRLLGTVSG
jgi:hypothetical protein